MIMGLKSVSKDVIGDLDTLWNVVLNYLVLY